MAMTMKSIDWYKGNAPADFYSKIFDEYIENAPDPVNEYVYIPLKDSVKSVPSLNERSLSAPKPCYMKNDAIPTLFEPSLNKEVYNNLLFCIDGTFDPTGSWVTSIHYLYQSLTELALNVETSRHNAITDDTLFPPRLAKYEIGTGPLGDKVNKWPSHVYRRQIVLKDGIRYLVKYVHANKDRWQKRQHQLEFLASEFKEDLKNTYLAEWLHPMADDIHAFLTNDSDTFEQILKKYEAFGNLVDGSKFYEAACDWDSRGTNLVG